MISSALDKDWDLGQVDAQTLAELSATRFRESSTGKIVLEPKAETKKRLLRSPDNADALLLAFYVPQESHSVEAGSWRPG